MINILNYSHGADIYTEAKENKINQNEIIDFSSNINSAGLPKGVKFSIIESLEYAHRYPDINCRDLKKSLSKYEKVAESQIYCSNGAVEIIFRLIDYIKPQKALILAPTFSEYEKALNKVNCEVEYYMLKEENDFKIQEDFTDYIKGSTDIVFVCNPNNPTGQIANKELLKKIIEKAKLNNATVVIDECFIDFVSEYEKYSVKEYLSSFDNIVILKAFTKIFAMAGIRLGYCLCNNYNTIKGLECNGPCWNVSSIAQVAGIAAVKETTYLLNSLKDIKEQSEFLYNSMSSLGFKVYEPRANYVFFKSDFGIDFKAQLIKYNILIRSCSNYLGLDDRFYRIAVKKETDNMKLIASIKEILKKQE